jgi:hypothetical protein
MPIEGNPDDVEDACRQLTDATRAWQAAGESVETCARAMSVDWTGPAASLALARMQQDAANVRRLIDAANGVIGPLTTYAAELRGAQQDYVRGQDSLNQGHSTAFDLSSSGVPPDEPPWDRARAAIDDGVAVMRAAEERAHTAGEAAARALDAATSSLTVIAPPAQPSLTPAAAPTSPMTGLGTIAASLGNAAQRHPEDVLPVIGGGLLAAVGAAGGLVSLALDGTGVGAIVGAPLGGASAAGVAAGVGIAGTGLIDLATHAATDSRVTPFQVDQDDESRIVERARTVGEPGKNKRVRIVPTAEDVRAIYDELSEGGTPIERDGYDGKAVSFPDGTEVGLRESSRTNDVTVDVQPPDGRRMRIHRKDDP